MKYSGLTISGMLRQNKFLLIILFSLTIFIKCTEKKSNECKDDKSLSFINIHSSRSIKKIKVNQYKNDVLKDSMIFFEDQKANGDYIFSKDGSNYSIELKKNYIFKDRFEIIIDNKMFVLKDFKMKTSKKATNYQHENLCELKEYTLNNQLKSNSAIMIDVNSD
ncbi:MAG: hypothetical protein J6O88_00505 [Chryseobacterium sp.]|uniref:hypothetical protein n=1 Tax=Chryseobacterium sp. TaxID=1871047 RepID=UPI001AFF9A7E|nr:hypothetical protein [Chryseobacterium sp.]MBO6183158.1 hypothetical protein [Chryseobacterium sp.]